MDDGMEDDWLDSYWEDRLSGPSPYDFDDVEMDYDDDDDE